jgi:hypothetical protein
MNLERLLAENMIRFNTKNVNGAILRTLLNEEYIAGAKVSTQNSLGNIKGNSSINSNINTYLGKYVSTKIGYGNGLSETLATPAMNALTYATIASIQTDKAVQKLLKSVNKSATFYQAETEAMRNALTDGSEFSGFSGGNTVIQELQRVAAELTKNITYTTQVVDIYPPPPGIQGQVATVGAVKSEYVDSAGKQKASGYRPLYLYMNAFNLYNTAVSNTAPDYTQYVLSDMIDANQYVDFQKTVSAINKIYVYTPGTKSPNVADKDVASTTVGATQPVAKDYDVSFDSGVATIPANDAEVAKAVQDAIAMFPDGNISNLTVVSSASPEYNKDAGGPSSMADYGQNTTGTGDPGAGTDNIAKNKKLAYDRGVSFMTALNAGLAAQGKPEITGYTINWQISDKGGVKVPGRYAQVQWEKAGTPGTAVTTTTATGTAGTTTGGQASYNMTQHEFSW